MQAFNAMAFAHSLYAMMKANDAKRGVKTVYKLAFKACLKVGQAKAKALANMVNAVKPVVKAVESVQLEVMLPLSIAFIVLTALMVGWVGGTFGVWNGLTALLALPCAMIVPWALCWQAGEAIVGSMDKQREAIQ